MLTNAERRAAAAGADTLAGAAHVAADSDDVTWAGPVPAAPDRDEARPCGLIALPVAIVVVLSVAGAGRPMWLDESISLAASQHLGSTLSNTHANMATYYLLAAGWTSVSTSVLWLRLLSVAVMAGAVAAFAALVARQWDLRTARWAGLFAATSYGVVVYGQQARSYALVCLLTVGAWAALDRLVDDAGDRPAWALHLACCALLPLTHGLSVLQLAAQGAVLLAAGVPRRVWTRAALGFGVAGIELVALLAVGTESNGNWVDPLSLDSAKVLVVSMFNPETWLAALLLVVVAAGAVAAVSGARRQSSVLARFRSLTPVGWGLGAVLLLLALSVVRPSELARYAAASYFGLALLTALGALFIGRRSSRPLAVPAVVLAVLLLGQVVLHTREPSGWAEATDLVAGRSRPSDQLVFPTSDARIPFDVAWREGRDAAPLRLVGQDGSTGSLDRLFRPQSPHALAQQLVGSDRVWVVNAPYAHQPGELPAFLADPVVEARFRVERQWDLDEQVTVLLLVPRSG